MQIPAVPHAPVMAAPTVVDEPLVAVPVNESAIPVEPAVLRPRLDSVDFLRGLVMVIMALDHVRDYFHYATPLFDPTDLTKTNAALFLTRWVTHFCAPVFVFLAGTGAFLSAARGKTRGELSRFLLTRGLWLVFLELTLIRFGWSFNVDYQFTVGQVIWAIGWSMVVLAVLVYLPVWIVTACGVLMIATHNLFDPIQSASLGSFHWLWAILHHPEMLEPLAGRKFFTAYPLVPWIGVMAAGYGFGQVLLFESHRRRRWLLSLGTALTLSFIILRAVNVYGDPQRWAKQSSGLFTLLSFINCTKYPPSLLYLLMTLGPAIIALALFDGVRDSSHALIRPFVVFGRVPLFYYLLHIPLIHLLAVVFAVSRYGTKIFSIGPTDKLPEDWGYTLPVVYLVWLGVVLALYPLCRWFANLKRRRRDAWLSYL
ncbi:MAG: DUF1624 domain-containing protein [Pyrinomonadaceae bacterium]